MPYKSPNDASNRNDKGNPIRPYARLLTMLGDQLIKNERIALVELAKNSYDADASWVKISFENFGKNYEINSNSHIVIEDDGSGMDLNIITNHWLNPATPVKKLEKLIKDTTSKGRKIQGEKGIGRFAVLKLGKKIEVRTRPINSPVELVVNFDFSRYDDEFLSLDGKEKEVFLDQLSIEVDKGRPQFNVSKEISLGGQGITRKSHGTRIDISGIKGVWTKDKAKDVYKDLTRLQPIFNDEFKNENKKQEMPDFNVYIYKDDEEEEFSKEHDDKLYELLKQNSVFRIEDGKYDEGNKCFKFNLNDTSYVLNLNDPDITGLSVFREHFVNKEKINVLDNRSTECGSFSFGLYIFDFSSNAEPKFYLDKYDKNIIRDHRIYLYRDGIRVYPYGDIADDWLRIDAYRGTISAGHFLSNDQVVGYVNISEKGNPKLKDKTNREGLIETGNSYDDFIGLLKTFLAYIRKKPYAQYRESRKERNLIDIFKEGIVQRDLDALKAAIGDNKSALTVLEQAEKHYKSERQFLVQRAETTEDLAGVGLSVETASHDIVAMMSKAMMKIDGLIQKSSNRADTSLDKFFEDLTILRGILGFVDARLRDIQLLFRSTKQRRKDIRVLDLLRKVEKIYDQLLKTSNITLEVEEVGSPLVAKTTDAVLLQLLLNLFDNSVYWLGVTSEADKRIKIRLDGKACHLIFSDNGPGIREDDAPYIFEPFYSGKGEAGRGLGLYIARQLLERHDYSIEIADIDARCLLKGANFIVSFIQEKK